MVKQQDLNDAILRAVDVVVNKRIDDLELDKTIVATIDQHLTPARDGSHRVKYAGGFFTAYAPIGTVYPPHSTVYVQVPQNDFSKRKTILGLASSYYTENDIETVSSAINNYMPIGTNVLTLKNSEYAEGGYGLNSYAQYNPEPYQETILLYDRTSNSQYDLNITEFNTYMQEAKAIMIQGDFRTSLLEEQQNRANAEYGINIDIVFKNQNSLYQNQGEMFEALASTPVKKTFDGDSYYDVTMQTYKNEVDKLFETAESFEELSLGFFDAYNKIENFIKDESEFSSQQYGIFKAFSFQILELMNEKPLVIEIQTENEGANIEENEGAEENEESQNTIEEYEDTKKRLFTIYQNWFEQPIGLTEDDQREIKTLTYSLNSSQMVGNPFAFNDFTTQYVILPIDTENFEYVERIYFYEKSFKVDGTRYQWVNKNRYKMNTGRKNEQGKPILEGKDIWVRNLALYPLKEITSEYGDYLLKIETPRGAGFYKENEQLPVQAAATYKYYTSINDDCSFYWFIKDNRVTSSMDSAYDFHGGVGWRFLGSTKGGQAPEIILKEEDNQAYENNYMCAAVYNGAAEGSITLKQEFKIWNYRHSRRINILSSLGAKFKFDTGTPTLTCTIDDKEEFFEIAEQEVRKDSAFKFYWTRRNPDGSVFSYTRTYEEAKAEHDSTIDYKQRLILETEMNNLRGVEFLIQKEEDGKLVPDIHGNKISCPLKYLTSNSQITFGCQVFTASRVSSEGEPTPDAVWYSIGDAELTILNEGAAQVNEYSIIIENGDQVFQYTESGVAPTIASGITPTDFRRTDPQEILPIKAHFYTPNGVEVSEGNYKIQWQYPLEDTLIIPPDSLELNEATEEYDTLSGQSAIFEIAPSYDYSCGNNQIKCIVSYNKQIYTTDTSFFFTKIGNNGTSGTDIVASISVDNDKNNISKKYPLTAFIYTIQGEEGQPSEQKVEWNIGEEAPRLKLELKNRYTNTPQELVNIQWKVLKSSRNNQFIILNEQEDGTVELNLDLEKTNVYQIIQGSAQLEPEGQRYYCAFPIVIGTYFGSNFDSFKNKKIYVDNNFLLKEILYNSDGQYPMYNNKQGIKLTNLNERYVHWETKGGNIQGSDVNNLACFKIMQNQEDVQGLQELKGNIDTVYILPDNTYAGDICDNRVIASVFFQEEDEVLVEQVQREIAEAEAIYQELIAQYKEEERQAKVEKQRKITAAEKEFQNTDYVKESKEETERQYQNAKTTRDVKITEADENYQETIRNIEESRNIAKNNLDTAIFSAQKKLTPSINSESSEEDWWKMEYSIPVYMTRNIYSLGSLNGWDGNSVDINHDDKYVFAPQMGAGIREKNGAFTGIIMGNVSQYGSPDGQVGLLGWNAGAQSIFLDSESGSAYFGFQDGVHVTKNQYGEISYENDDYNEGRIELIPGGKSQIGGWRLGHRMLYYTGTKDLGSAYSDNPINYGRGHEKDIEHSDQGILLYAGGTVRREKADGSIEEKTYGPYLSIKGRQLNQTGDIDQTASARNITEDDSLELQLDPQQRSIFSIFVHQKQDNESYERILLSGIDNKGRFIANRIENPAPADTSKGSSTSFEVTPLKAFNESNENYVGANFEAGQSIDNTVSFFRFFVDKDDVQKGNIYIDGGNGNNDRQLSVHSKNIILYANGGDKSGKPSDDPSNPNKYISTSKISISASEAYIGNPGAYLRLMPFGEKNTELHSSRPVDFSFNNSYTVNSGAYNFTASSINEISTGSISRTSSGAHTISSGGTLKLERQNESNPEKLELQQGNSYLGNKNVYLSLNSKINMKSKGNIAFEAGTNGGDQGDVLITSYSNNGMTFTANSTNTQILNTNSALKISPSKIDTYTTINNWSSDDIQDVHEFNFRTGGSGSGCFIQNCFALKPTYQANDLAWMTSGWKIYHGIETGWVHIIKETIEGQEVTNGNLLAEGDLSSGNNIFIHGWPGYAEYNELDVMDRDGNLIIIIQKLLEKIQKAHERADDAYAYAERADTNANNRVDWDTYNSHKHEPSGSSKYLVAENGSAHVSINGTDYAVTGITYAPKTGTPA